jgi:hypothetical protein
MGKFQRTKGAVYEREVSAAIKAELGFDARRNLLQTREGGGDIILPGFMVECKRRAAISVYQWLDQCQAACKDAQKPIVIARADKRKSIAIIELDLLLELLKGHV